MLSRDITLIVKVTNRCNFHCKYCFIEPHVFDKVMALATLERVITAFLQSTYFKSVHFVWHGGEPLLRGIDFFRVIVDLQERYGSSVLYDNSVQTNASGLNEAMLEFLVANRFHIGFSLDGPADINDALRETGSARSSHAYVVNAIQRLQRQGQPTGAIVVLNRGNRHEARRIYAEFKRLRLNMKINPLTKSGLGDVNYEDLSITAEEYGRFMIELFDLWFDDPDPVISIEPLESHVATILELEGAVRECVYSKSCHKGFLGISPDGNYFPCGMFQGMPEFNYGNVFTLPPEKIPDTATWQRLDRRENVVLQGCRQCDFYHLCYGGCVYHSIKNRGDFEERDYYCAGYKALFAHMVERLSEDLGGARRKRRRERPHLAAAQSEAQERGSLARIDVPLSTLAASASRIARKAQGEIVAMD
jgi:uncharacterized protein